MLYSNKQYFESSVQIAERLFEEKLYEDCINYIEKTASFGWFNFSGYYKSEHLEMLLAKIQEKILLPVAPRKKINKTNKILHICSEVYTSGGHSKLIYTWIKNNKSKKHTLLTTRQSLKDIEEISRFYLHDFPDLEHKSVLSTSKIESAKLLQAEVNHDYDAIMLHTHPDETLANLVLSQKGLLTPVCFINHADHVFWLGTSIADLVLQIRESNITIDRERRGISADRQFFLPIPVENDFREENKHQESNTDIIHILSTGTAYKYNPNERYNFLQEAYKIVEENPELIFNIVGINSDSEYGKQYQHERIVLHGLISPSALAEIEKTAHIYVEGFPMASFTALLQPALQKIPFALHYEPIALCQLFNNKPEEGIIYPENLQEWHSNLRNLISNNQFRRDTAEKQFNYISNNYSIDVWKSRIEDLYSLTDKRVHSFYPPTPDRYYDGNNEKLLVTFDKREFPHYQFTRKLSLSGKYFVYQLSKSKNINISYLRGKKLLKYFLKKK